MKDETLAAMGKLIEGDLPRDAVHIAVVPVTASRPLAAGEHIGLMPDGRAGGGADGVKAIGIVDPYLTVHVFEGDRFFLFLYPGSITSLKHLWTHPAFDDDSVAVAALDPKAASEKWLREYAEDVGLSYSKLMEIARDSNGDDGFYHTINYDTPSRHYDDRKEFWRHYEAVTGEKAEDTERTFFNCSC